MEFHDSSGVGYGADIPELTMIRIISNEDAVTMSNADKISDTLAVAPEAGTDATEGAAIGDAKK